MAATTKWYSNGVSAVANAAVDFDTDTMRITLHTSSYTPNLSTHDFYDDVSPGTTELANGNGYTTDGQALAGKARSLADLATDEVRLDANDVTWNFTANKTFRYAVIRKDRGGADSADELVALVDFGADQTVGVDFTISWPSDGVIKFTVTP